MHVRKQANKKRLQQLTFTHLTTKFLLLSFDSLSDANRSAEKQKHSTSTLPTWTVNVSENRISVLHRLIINVRFRYTIGRLPTVLYKCVFLPATAVLSLCNIGVQQVTLQLQISTAGANNGRKSSCHETVIFSINMRRWLSETKCVSWRRAHSATPCSKVLPCAVWKVQLETDPADFEGSVFL